MKHAHAEILREYGPFPGADDVAGVTFDGTNVWFASGDRINAFDPESGEPVRSIDVAAHAGTTFDGEHLYQLAEDVIHNDGTLETLRRQVEQLHARYCALARQAGSAARGSTQ